MSALATYTHHIALRAARPIREGAVPMLHSNDDGALVPRVSFDGPMLEFDFPALRIGVAEYEEGPTGWTVFHFPAGVKLAVDVRGGSPAVLGDYGWTNAVCFAGGSVYGLEAVSGVAAELFAQRAYSTRWDTLALASGAIVYDFVGRDNAIYPDKRLGQAALQAGQAGRFPLGRRGAGRFVTGGRGFGFDKGEPGGQGAALRQVGETKVAVFTVVNAMGAIVDRGGRVVCGHLDRTTGRRQSLAVELERGLGEEDDAPRPWGNTTLTLLATNRKLDARTLGQLGWQVHASMARAIQPFHAIEDGDVLFAVTTDEVGDEGLNAGPLGVLASEVAWGSVLNSVQDAGENVGEQP
ncbi:MAG: P1 family peptidase [Chloroflexota bacterium]|nr:P1 family peptidase [Chloroflexota bacterium]